MAMNVIDQLQAQVKDEQEAVELYTKLADEVDNKGFYRRAYLLRGVAADEKRHITIVKDALEEIKTIGALVGATSRGAAESHEERMARQEEQLKRGEKLLEKGREILGRPYWYVRLGSGVRFEKFDTPEQAKKYVEERTRKRLSKAKWINAYGFELGTYKGPEYISFFEGDENTRPTKRHTWGKFS